MQVSYGRHFLAGDLANCSIGQGDILVTPLQMAQAMATVANGGTLFQSRIVRQVQTLSGEVVYTYSPRAKDLLKLGPVTREELKEGMIGVVNSKSGTGGSAGLDNVKVAGKNGPAQWGAKRKESTAAWVSGVAPAGNTPDWVPAPFQGGGGGERPCWGQALPPIRGCVL